MPFENQSNEFQVEQARVQIYPSLRELGPAAGRRAAELISKAIKERGAARVIAATGNSQIPLVENLVTQPVNWKLVELFHMDEYIGISAAHPSSFRYWIKTRLDEKVHPGKVFYITGDAPDLKSEIKRYSDLL